MCFGKGDNRGMCPQLSDLHKSFISDWMEFTDMAHVLQVLLQYSKRVAFLSGWCSRAWNWSAFESSWSSRALFMKFSQALFAFMLHSSLFRIMFLEFTRMMSRDCSAPKLQKHFGCSVKCCHMKNQNVLGRRLGACRSHWHTFDLSHSSHSILGTAEHTWNDNVETFVPMLCQKYLVK